MATSKKGWLGLEPWEIAVYLIAAAALIWIYADHVLSMANNWWNDPNYSHGFLVPLISAYLIVRQKEQLPGLVSKPQCTGVYCYCGQFADPGGGIFGQ
jgi:hypothetical protein